MVRKLKEEYDAAGLTMNMAKCEYLIVSNEEVKDLKLDVDRIRGAEKSKYLGVIFNQQGSSKDEIQEHVNKERTVIRTLNSFLWERSITRNTKKHVCNSMVQSVILYSCLLYTSRCV